MITLLVCPKKSQELQNRMLTPVGSWFKCKEWAAPKITTYKTHYPYPHIFKCNQKKEITVFQIFAETELSLLPQLNQCAL